ncbi:MAG: cyclic nucleotide-binding domain-containing protein [Gammaproteobacteria bacterium]|nr:cyclic nucleotide-binding domain-containing protein [Gammaproteobacteria bacterium]
MPVREPSDRRQTARIPAGAKLLHRAVGMGDYALCDVVNITTSGIELLLERPLPTGTVVTILVPTEGSSRSRYRVIGIVQRSERRRSRWLHVVRASHKRPWSSMFIYDVIYQALTGAKPWPGAEWLYVENTADPGNDTDDHYAATVPHLEHPDEPAESGEDESAPCRAPGWCSPFDAFSDPLRRLVARQQRVTSRPAGTVLVTRGSLEDHSIYLVEGTVRIEAYDGKLFEVAAGTRDAHFPISVLRPHAYTVTAVSNVSVILLDRQTMDELARIVASHGSVPGIEVSEGGPLPAELEEA